MFKIYAINTEFTANNDAAVNAIMDTRPVQKTLASNVKSNPDFIVARKNDTVQPDVMNVSVKIVDRSYTMANSPNARNNVLNVIQCWAQKSRVPGVRGDRLAVVSDIKQVASMRDNGEYDMFEVKVSLGTAVFYNQRRVTVNFPASVSEFAQDLTNLMEHLKEVGAIDQNTGVIVTNPTFGEFNSGNTSTEVDADDEYDADNAADELAYLRDEIESIDPYNGRESLLDELYELKNSIQSLIDSLEAD